MRRTIALLRLLSNTAAGQSLLTSYDYSVTRRLVVEQNQQASARGGRNPAAPEFLTASRAGSEPARTCRKCNIWDALRVGPSCQ
jgi:hypothetical protein